MPWKPLQAMVLAGLVVLAGCVAAVPSAMGTGTTSTPSATQTEAIPPHNGSGGTAHFILNNLGSQRYNVSVYVVADQPESKALFPVNVTFRNGTTLTVGEPDELPQVPFKDAIRIEPANGTVVAVHQPIPPRSTVRIDVQNAPEDAMWLGVVYRTGTQEATVTSYGLSDGICTGSEAAVVTFNESFSSSATCGNVSDLEFPDSLSRHTVPAGNSSEDGSG